MLEGLRCEAESWTCIPVRKEEDPLPSVRERPHGESRLLASLCSKEVYFLQRKTQVVLGTSSGELGFSPTPSSNKGNPLPPWCQTKQLGTVTRCWYPPPPSHRDNSDGHVGSKSFHCLPALMRSPSLLQFQRRISGEPGLLAHLAVMSVHPSFPCQSSVSEEAS